MESKLARGQIHMVQLGVITEDSGSLQKGLRPCVIISNHLACKYSPIISVVPLTSKRSKRPIPTHTYIEVDGYNNLRKDSIALCEQIITVNRSQIQMRTGELSPSDMFAVDKCLGVSMGLTLA